MTTLPSLKHIRPAGLLLAIAMLGGCASVPDVTIRYLPITWSAGYTAVVTLACVKNPDGGEPGLVTATAVAVAARYAAHRDSPPVSIALKDLDTWFADADLKISFTEDGRLKSINASSTGQAEAVIKGVVGAATVFSTLMAAQPADKPAEGAQGALPAGPSTCQVLQAAGLTKDPVSLVYRPSTAINAQALDRAVDLKPAEESRWLHDRLIQSPDFPRLSLQVGKIDDRSELTRVQAKPAALAGSVVRLPLQQVGRLMLQTTATGPGGRAQTVDTSTLIVPLDQTYDLPIPKPALFGKAAFSLSLAESGRVVEVGYGKTSGAAGALGAITSLGGAELQALNAETAAMKAEADFIAQQQRLMNCRLKPADCK